MPYNEKYLEDMSLFWELLARLPKEGYYWSKGVLNAGCGYGRFTIPLACKCEYVVALDLFTLNVKTIKSQYIKVRIN